MPFLDWDFHPKYVQPFYLKIGFNLLNKEHDEQAQTIEDIKAVIDELDHDTVINLFKRGGWRARNSIGFILGYANWHQYISIIGETMLGHPDYTTIFCFALARFGKEESILWLTEYLDRYMINEFSTELRADVYKVDSALAALEILDEIHNTNFSKSYYPEKFHSFTSQFQRLYHANNDLLSPWNIDVERHSMKELINFAETHFD